MLRSGNTTTTPSSFSFSSQLLGNLHKSSDNVPKQEKNLRAAFQSPCISSPSKEPVLLVYLHTPYLYGCSFMVPCPLQSSCNLLQLGAPREGPALITGATSLNRTLFPLPLRIFSDCTQDTANLFLKALQGSAAPLHLVFLGVLQMPWLSGGTLMFCELPDL